MVVQRRDQCFVVGEGRAGFQQQTPNTPTHTHNHASSSLPPFSLLLAAEFDAAFLLGELPKVLDIEDKRVRMLLKELVGTRK